MDFTTDELNQIKDSVMNNARVSLEIDGLSLSDEDFEKVKVLADKLEEVI